MNANGSGGNLGSARQILHRLFPVVITNTESCNNNKKQSLSMFSFASNFRYRTTLPLPYFKQSVAGAA